MRRRVSCAQLAVMEILSEGEQRISYDELAVRTGYDPRTIICAVKRLRCKGRLHIIERGRGATPNRYVVA